MNMRKQSNLCSCLLLAAALTAVVAFGLDTGYGPPKSIGKVLINPGMG